MNSSTFWAVLSFLVVAVTKYLTSVRLRRLRERIHKDQEDANELKRMLSTVSEKEGQVKAENEELHAKLTAMRNINVNLERTMNRLKGQQGQAPAESE